MLITKQSMVEKRKPDHATSSVGAVSVTTKRATATNYVIHMELDTRDLVASPLEDKARGAHQCNCRCLSVNWTILEVHGNVKTSKPF